MAAAQVVLNTELMRIQVWFAAAETAWDDQVNYAYVKYVDATQAKYDLAKAQGKDTTSLKAQLDAAKATANTYLAPYKATYEAQKKTRDQQNSAANTVFSHGQEHGRRQFEGRAGRGLRPGEPDRGHRQGAVRRREHAARHPEAHQRGVGQGARDARPHHQGPAERSR